MTAPIKSGGPPAANFDKLSQNHEKATEAAADAGNHVQPFKAEGKELGPVTPASAKAYFATSQFDGGAGDTADAASQAAKAGGRVAPGFAGWAAEDVRAGGRQVAKGAARGLSGIVQTLTRVLGDGRQATVRELQRDPSGMRFSERTFGKAAAKLQMSDDAMAARWRSYLEALSNLAGVGRNLPLAATHAAGVASNLAKAAALTTSASATKMAEYGSRLGSAGAQAAEQGVAGAREVMLLSARFSAATADILWNPDSAQVQGQLRQTRTELQQLLRNNSGLQHYVRPLIA